MSPREFPDKPTPRPDGDPANDPPLTVRVQGGHDRWTRLFDPHARRAVRADVVWPARWAVLTGSDRHDGGPEVGAWLTDEQVADWTVVPAVFVHVPWSSPPPAARRAARVEPAGDMDVEAFRG